MRKSGTLLPPPLASPSRLSSPCLSLVAAGGSKREDGGHSRPFTADGDEGGSAQWGWGKKYGTPRWEGRVQVQTTDLLKRFQTARPPLDFPISLPLIPQLPPPHRCGWRLLCRANYPALRNGAARAWQCPSWGWAAEEGPSSLPRINAGISGRAGRRKSNRCALLQTLRSGEEAVRNCGPCEQSEGSA